MKKQAIGYIRVSSEEQIKNYSLANQEEYIREVAERQGFELVEIFRDEGESAKTTDRPGLIEALAYAREKKKDINALLIYKIDRLARNTIDYLAIRQLLSKSGIKIISATEPTGDTPEGEFIETILAATARFDNALKAKRTLDGMKKRLEAGWPHGKAPIGYLNTESPDGEKIVIKDPEKFDLVKRGWIEMETGLYTINATTKKFQEWGLITCRGKTISEQKVSELFRNKFYMGILTSKSWGEFKGKHEPMISEKTFYKVQAILDGKSFTAVPKLRNNPDFPLRNFVICGNCNRPMTGSWTKGRSKRYPYYHCARCKSPFSRSTPKEQLEQEFISLLESIVPKKEVLRLFQEIVKATWKERYKMSSQAQITLQRALDELKAKREALIEKNLRGVYSDELFKEQLVKIDEEILIKKSLLSESEMDKIDIETLLNFASRFLEDFPRLWVNSNLEQKQRLQAAIFPEGLIWGYSGFRTPQLSLCFQLLQEKRLSRARLGWCTGVEPAKSPPQGDA